jgi:hypothetical protein
MYSMAPFLKESSIEVRFVLKRFRASETIFILNSIFKIYSSGFISLLKLAKLAIKRVSCPSSIPWSISLTLEPF